MVRPMNRRETSRRVGNAPPKIEISKPRSGASSENEISQPGSNAKSKIEISKTHPGADAKAPETNTTESVSTDKVVDEPETYIPTPEELDGDGWLEKVHGDPKDLPLTVKLYCFHTMDAKGRPTGVVDARIYKYLVHTQDIFVCGETPYIYQGGYYHPDTNKGAILKTLISDCLLEQYVRSTTIERIYKLFLQRKELIRYPEELNCHSGWYINFQNGMYDVKRRKLFPHSPKILSVNQIPWDYDPDADHGAGVEIEKFLQYAVPDKDDREMLLEYMGLCLTTDVDQQKMLVICGLGGTGKSTLINLIEKIVGRRNISNVPMGRLSEKFQAITMMGKLLNSCADLEIDALDDVTAIKKLIGEDAISDCYKGKDNISFNNYAKMLFSTNELPLVRNEKTQGFYRRILALSMNKIPDKRDPMLQKKLTGEIPYLIHKMMTALKRMYDRGTILESESSKAMTKQLRLDSDTVEAFLDACCEKDDNGKVPRSDLFEKYTEFCKEWERQPHQKTAFFKAMRNKAYREVKYNGNHVFYGLRLKGTDSDDFMKVPEGNVDDIPFGV